MIKRQFRSLAAAQILAALAVTVSLLIDGMLTSRFLGKDAITAFGLAYRMLFKSGLDEMCHRLSLVHILVYGPAPGDMFQKHMVSEFCPIV